MQTHSCTLSTHADRDSQSLYSHTELAEDRIMAPSVICCPLLALCRAAALLPATIFIASKSQWWKQNYCCPYTTQGHYCIWTWVRPLSWSLAQSCNRTKYSKYAHLLSRYHRSRLAGKPPDSTLRAAVNSRWVMSAHLTQHHSLGIFQWQSLCTGNWWIFVEKSQSSKGSHMVWLLCLMRLLSNMPKLTSNHRGRISDWAVWYNTLCAWGLVWEWSPAEITHLI